MIAFIDSTVFLRKLLGEPHSLREWETITEAYASRLVRVEIGRTIDRLRMLGSITDAQVVRLQLESRRIMDSVDLIELNDDVLERAAGPMPTVVGSLDAVHVSSALELEKTLEKRVTLLTHDEQLGAAAAASGMKVLGLFRYKPKE